MTALRDPRSAVEVQAALAIRYRHEWPWAALKDAVEFGASEGHDRERICNQTGLPWWFIASQYRQHGTDFLPDSLKDEA